jgi:ferritin-like metal-binding protein YciE
MSTLREAFVKELADLYDAEKQIIKALPKMAKAAEHDELKQGFEQHLEETEQHVNRLEQVFELLGEKPRTRKCKGIEGIIKEGEEDIKEKEGDAALICGAQKVEHYEMAAYGSLVSWARLLEEEEAADLLEETLDEEKSTDEKLTEAAENIVNAEEKEEEEEEPRKRKAA